MKPFAQCDYSAFISYAHADDEAWFSWVTRFRNELAYSLPGLLRARVPPLHLSGENGPVSGVLSDELKKRIAASFALIIVVHDNYAQSDWCLKELEYFKSLFGDDGFRERFYIVALSQKAMSAVEAKPDWKRLCPPDLLWIPFFQKMEQDVPVAVHSGIISGKPVVTQEFMEPFLKLREDLVQKIRNSLAEPSAADPLPSALKPPDEKILPPSPSEPVRIYIESNQNERGLWEPLGKQIEKKWNAIVGQMHLVPPLYVRSWGLPVDQIDQWPKLDDADGVVLLWGHKTPDALVAQINKVERKLSGRDVAPGIVAYLIPPHDNPQAPMPAWGWKVLRFDAKLDTDIDVVKEEADDLQKFLQKILERTTSRRAIVATPAAAPSMS